MAATRKTSDRNVAGRTFGDRRVWNTYLYWARSSFPAIDPTLQIAKPENRLTVEQDRALQSIVFTAFVLEYRLKRTFEYVGIAFRRRDGLGTLVAVCRERIEQARTRDGRAIVLPREWLAVEERLKRLVELRNAVAHADYAKVRSLTRGSKSLGKEARQSYNAVVDAIRILKQAVKDDTRRGRAARQHYDRLKVKP
jgi:hypothetical protein